MVWPDIQFNHSYWMDEEARVSKSPESSAFVQTLSLPHEYLSSNRHRGFYVFSIEVRKLLQADMCSDVIKNKNEEETSRSIQSNVISSLPYAKHCPTISFDIPYPLMSSDHPHCSCCCSKC